MALRTISDLARTMLSYLRIGTIRIKDNSGDVEAKNGADSAYAKVAAGGLKLKGSSSGTITINPPAAAGSATYELPGADGSSGQVLSTDGAGTLSWANAATGTNQVKQDSTVIAYNASSPVAMFTPPANATIRRVTVEVETTFGGSSPTLSIGVAGSTSRYMGTTDIDLTVAGIYEVDAAYEEDGTPDAIIATIGGSPATQGSARVTVEYVIPD